MSQAQADLNTAVLYALKSGCFFPVPEPKPGATVEELIRWGALRNLHRAIANFYPRPEEGSPP